MFTTNDLLIVIDMQKAVIGDDMPIYEQQDRYPSTPTATTISKPRKAIICPSRTA